MHKRNWKWTSFCLLGLLLVLVLGACKSNDIDEHDAAPGENGEIVITDAGDGRATDENSDEKAEKDADEKLDEEAMKDSDDKAKMDAADKKAAEEKAKKDAAADKAKKDAADKKAVADKAKKDAADKKAAADKAKKDAADKKAAADKAKKDAAEKKAAEEKKAATSNKKSFVDQVIDLTNAERKKAGLPALKKDPQLMKAAQAYSADMKKRGVMDHNGSPTYGDFPGVIDAFGIKWMSVAENIAWGQPDAESVMSGWMNSPGHKANILGSGYTHIGVGKDGAYWTQHFISK